MAEDIEKRRFIRHREERSDVAIQKLLILQACWIAALRSQ